MESYDAKSCSSLAKLHYRPVDAALRWCGLIEHEVKILKATDGLQYPPLGSFPQWPCLRTNIEAIVDALENGDLPHGRDGKTVNPGDHVALGRRTIRHSDLKEWMVKNHPDQKPKFLFDDVERTTHSKVNVESYLVLKADRDALKARIEKAIEVYSALKVERDSLAATAEKYSEQQKALTTTERKTLLTIIAALAKHAKIDVKEAGKSAQYISGLTEEMGASVSKRTIEDHLKKIPDALEVRMK